MGTPEGEKREILTSRSNSNSRIPPFPSIIRAWEISESLDIARFTAIHLGVGGGRFIKTSERIALYTNGHNNNNMSTFSAKTMVSVYNKTIHGRGTDIYGIGQVLRFNVHREISEMLRSSCKPALKSESASRSKLW